MNRNKEYQQDAGRYDDIIDLPHHVSRVHPQMPQENRAAQFAPFAALTGYEGAVAESARLTDPRIELDEDEITRLNEQLQTLKSGLGRQPSVSAKITYFVPDEKKSGGEYRTIDARIKKIDTVNQLLYLTDQSLISIREIIWIEGGRSGS